MSEKYPLYPELPEAGREEAQVLVDRFKKQLQDAAEEVLGRLYTDIVVHIQSDSWTNFRNELMEGFQDYRNRLVQGEYDFKRIREKIYSEYRAEIIRDLDQDNLKRIEALQKEVSELRDRLNEEYRRY